MKLKIYFIKKKSSSSLSSIWLSQARARRVETRSSLSRARAWVSSVKLEFDCTPKCHHSTLVNECNATGLELRATTSMLVDVVAKLDC